MKGAVNIWILSRRIFEFQFPFSEIGLLNSQKWCLEIIDVENSQKNYLFFHFSTNFNKESEGLTVSGWKETFQGMIYSFLSLNSSNHRLMLPIIDWILPMINQIILMIDNFSITLNKPSANTPPEWAVPPQCVRTAYAPPVRSWGGTFTCALENIYTQILNIEEKVLTRHFKAFRRSMQSSRR